MNMSIFPYRYFVPQIVNMGEGFDSWDSTYGDKRPPAQSNRTAKVLIITHSRNNVDKEEN